MPTSSKPCRYEQPAADQHPGAEEPPLAARFAQQVIQSSDVHGEAKVLCRERGRQTPGEARVIGGPSAVTTPAGCPAVCIDKTLTDRARLRSGYFERSDGRWMLQS